MLNKLVKYYIGITGTHGILRGFYYHYENKKDNINNFFMITAITLINPVYIYYSLNHDIKNFKLYLDNKKIIKKDWIYY